MKHVPGLKIIGWSVLVLWLGAWVQGAAAGGREGLAKADRLCQSSTLDLRQALEALDLYEGLLAQGQDDRLPILTRLTRLCFILGELTIPSQRQKYYEKGRDYALTLCREQPRGVAGPYWLALHRCGLAEVGAKGEGLKLLPQIMEGLERALALDASYDQAGPHRVLGRIYYEAPAWPMSVGDLKKSLQHLTAATRLAPENSTNHLYLAQTLLRLENPSQAKIELEQVLRCTRHALWRRGLDDDCRVARGLLTECDNCIEQKASGLAN